MVLRFEARKYELLGSFQDLDGPCHVPVDTYE